MSNEDSDAEHEEQGSQEGNISGESQHAGHLAPKRTLLYWYPCTITRQPATPASDAFEVEQDLIIDTEMVEQTFLRLTGDPVSEAKVREWAKKNSKDLEALLAIAKTCSPVDAASEPKSPDG